MSSELDQMIKPLMLKDLREQLRARGENPGGGIEDLRIRLKEHMIASGDMRISINGAPAPQLAQPGHGPSSFGGGNTGGNNYTRPSGQQNVGNYISDRPSSRVIAPPGGGSQIQFGDDNTPAHQQRGPVSAAPFATESRPTMASSSAVYGSGTKETVDGSLKNNYSRPSGMQNVGNMLTDRPSSKVLAPPGGKSQISFG